MNINIMLSNGMNENVDLICYFTGNNGKNYLFYTKNETVQDGLIKMYVALENGVISDTEWTELKKDMQQIIMGNSTVKFLNYSNVVNVGETRAIALNNTNIASIKNAYKNATNNNLSTNKDLLSQSFNERPQVQSTVQQTPSEPVQISSIPNVQNNFNMESSPVNLNPNVEPIAPVVDSVPKIEPINPVVTPDIPSVNTNGPALNINEVKPSGIDSGFRVSNEPNIFDQPSSPFSISEEDLNKPLVNSAVNNGDAQNIFNTNQESPMSNVNSVDVNSNVNKTSNNDKIDVNRQIELNEKKIKLFTELANVYKEENEILKSESEVNDNTASNLFNNNGTLDDLKILQG